MENDMAYRVKSDLQMYYKELKERNPELTIDEFIERIRGHKPTDFYNKDFQQHAMKMLLSSQEVVKKKEEVKQPIELGQ